MEDNISCLRALKFLMASSDLRKERNSSTVKKKQGKNLSCIFDASLGISGILEDSGGGKV